MTITPKSGPARSVLYDVLADLHFPAQRWQVITAAELYGAGPAVRSSLHALGAPAYPDLASVIDEVLGGRPHGSRAPRPKLHPSTRNPVPDPRSHPWSTRCTTAR